MSNRQVVFVVSDTHSGSSEGLLLKGTSVPSSKLDGTQGEDMLEGNETTEWLSDRFKRCIKHVNKLAGGSPAFFIHTGDVCWGDKHVEQLISTRKADQILIAMSMFRYVIENVKNIYGIRIAYGTQSHEFGEGTAPELISSILKDNYKKIDIESTPHGLVTLDGVVIDYAHHGPSAGTYPWTKGNVARSILRSIMIDSIDNSVAVPRMILRGHRHMYVHETLRIPYAENGLIKEHQSDLILLPSFCGMTHYARQASKSQSYLRCGMVAFVLEEGHITKIEKMIFSEDLRTQEEFVNGKKLS